MLPYPEAPCFTIELIDYPIATEVGVAGPANA
jgi:hypothetical protein